MCDQKEMYITMLAERGIDHGIDVYLLEKYESLREAIVDGNIGRVESIRDTIYRDISVDDIPRKMYQGEKSPRPLLSLCVDNSRDEIGKYLISQGASWNITVQIKVYLVLTCIQGPHAQSHLIIICFLFN